MNERAKVDYIVSEGLYNTRRYKDEADRQSRVRKPFSKWVFSRIRISFPTASFPEVSASASVWREHS